VPAPAKHFEAEKICLPELIGSSRRMLKFVFLFVDYERSYDKFHDQADNIYSLAFSATIGDTKINQIFTSSIPRKRATGSWPLTGWPDSSLSLDADKNEPLAVIRGR
jgi:hypothetical protein